jgi:hypothetical protein
MVKCSVLFEVRSESLNITYTSFGLKGLIAVAVLWDVYKLWNFSSFSILNPTIF